MKRAIIALTFVMPMLTACFNDESRVIQVISATPNYYKAPPTVIKCSVDRITVEHEEDVPIKVLDDQPLVDGETLATAKIAMKTVKSISHSVTSDCGTDPELLYARIHEGEVGSYTVTFTYKGREVTTVIPGPKLVLNIAEFDERQTKQ